jgi:hypothetical protein
MGRRLVQEGIVKQTTCLGTHNTRTRRRAVRTTCLGTHNTHTRRRAVQTTCFGTHNMRIRSGQCNRSGWWYTGERRPTTSGTLMAGFQGRTHNASGEGMLGSPMHARTSQFSCSWAASAWAASSPHCMLAISVPGLIPKRTGMQVGADSRDTYPGCFVVGGGWKKKKVCFNEGRRSVRPRECRSPRSAVAWEPKTTASVSKARDVGE